MEYYIVNTDELTHHGIKGMRWGIRRYQNKDGSLTKAGQRRYKKELEAIRKEEAVLKNRKATAAKLAKLDARRKAIDDGNRELDGDDESKKTKTSEPKPAVKKSVKDMTDEELAFAIRRMQMEKQYESLTTQPQVVDKGNSFVKDFMSKSAVPAVQEAGKTLIRDSLLKLGKKHLGLNENAEDYVAKLGKEVKKMTLEKQFKKLKEEAAAEVNTSKEKAKTDGDTSKGSKADTDTNTNASKTDDGVGGFYTGKGGERWTRESGTQDSGSKVYEGFVEGVGTSRRTTNQGRTRTSDNDIIDAEYWTIVSDNNTSSGKSYISNHSSLPISGLPESTANIGRSQVSNYLALPAPGLPAPKADDD